MTVEGITLVRSGSFVTVTLDRPSKRNAVSLRMWQGLADIFADLGRDDTLRAAILTGAGGTFSAGADIADFAETRATPEQALDYEVAVDAACDAIAALPRPVVAVIAGHCFGGACNLAMACDFRFVAPTATMAIPAAKLSIVYGVRGTARLLALVGPAEAKRILFGAKPFDAEWALRNGFADRVSADPLADAKAFLAEMATLAPLSIAGAKHVINALAHPDQPYDSVAGDAVIRRAMESRDYAEGRAAFAAKRPPRFEGR